MTPVPATATPAADAASRLVLAGFPAVVVSSRLVRVTVPRPVRAARYVLAVVGVDPDDTDARPDPRLPGAGVVAGWTPDGVRVEAPVREL